MQLIDYQIQLAVVSHLQNPKDGGFDNL